MACPTAIGRRSAWPLAMRESGGRWVVYLLRCRGDRLYCGVTNDLEARWQAHRLGKGAKFTRAFPPIAFDAAMDVDGKRTALRIEATLKRLPKARKAAKLRELAANGEGILLAV